MLPEYLDYTYTMPDLSRTFLCMYFSWAILHFCSKMFEPGDFIKESNLLRPWFGEFKVEALLYAWH